MGTSVHARHSAGTRASDQESNRRARTASIERRQQSVVEEEAQVKELEAVLKVCSGPPSARRRVPALLVGVGRGGWERAAVLSCALVYCSRLFLQRHH